MELCCVVVGWVHLSMLDVCATRGTQTCWRERLNADMVLTRAKLVELWSVVVALRETWRALVDYIDYIAVLA